MPAARRTFTRTQLTAALDAADVDIPGDAFYARRLNVWEGRRSGHPSALALHHDTPADLLTFAVVVAGMLGTGALEFAGAAQADRSGTYWPGYQLDEPTEEELLYLPGDDSCPDDPDGAHHSACGCDVDPINPAARVSVSIGSEG